MAKDKDDQELQEKLKKGAKIAEQFRSTLDNPTFKFSKELNDTLKVLANYHPFAGSKGTGGMGHGPIAGNPTEGKEAQDFRVDKTTDAEIWQNAPLKAGLMMKHLSGKLSREWIIKMTGKTPDPNKNLDETPSGQMSWPQEVVAAIKKINLSAAATATTSTAATEPPSKPRPK